MTGLYSAEVPSFTSLPVSVAHVMIGGGSKVRTDVPPFIKADRDPLSYLGLNSVGLTRRGFRKERIDEIIIYTELFIRKE